MKKDVAKKQLLADKFTDLANLVVGSIILSQVVSKKIDVFQLVLGIITVVALYVISYFLY